MFNAKVVRKKNFLWRVYREDERTLRAFLSTDILPTYQLVYHIKKSISLLSTHKITTAFTFTLPNVCREKGLLLSFVYIFGRGACQCCLLPPSDVILAQLA
jgi:hypothetical protein